jgi:hypothetical protein
LFSNFTNKRLRKPPLVSLVAPHVDLLELLSPKPIANQTVVKPPPPKTPTADREVVTDDVPVMLVGPKVSKKGQCPFIDAQNKIDNVLLNCAQQNKNNYYYQQQKSRRVDGIRTKPNKVWQYIREYDTSNINYKNKYVRDSTSPFSVTPSEGTVVIDVNQFDSLDCKRRKCFMIFRG